MKIEILNSFQGDKEEEIDTITPEGKAAASKLIEELLRTGSTIFLERQEGGRTKSYRVTGYNAETDRIVIGLDSEEKSPEDARIEKPRPRRGRKPRAASVPYTEGTMTSVAPVAGGCRGILG